jgi:hypothetical protein
MEDDDFEFYFDGVNNKNDFLFQFIKMENVVEE